MMLFLSTSVWLGTNIGFSACVMGLAMQDDAYLETIEFKAENAIEARLNIEFFNLSQKITVTDAEALTFVQNLAPNRKFDFIFIDANKKDNAEYILNLTDHVEPGGIICIDNLLWKGRTTARSLVDDGGMESTLQIRKFNRELIQNKKWYSQILPIGDGIALCIKF